MKLKFSELKKMISEYDQTKGFFRKMFSIDSKQILALKEFISSLEDADTGAEEDISYEQFLAWVKKQKLDIDLSPEYLQSGSESAKIFSQWSILLNIENLKPIVNINNLLPPNLLQPIDYHSIIHDFEVRLEQPVNRIDLTAYAEVKPLFINNNYPHHFQKKPETLCEQGIKFIVKKLIENPNAFDTTILPEDLQEKIMDRLEQEKARVKENFLEELLVNTYLKFSDKIERPLNIRFFTANNSGPIVLPPDVDPNAEAVYPNENNNNQLANRH